MNSIQAASRGIRTPYMGTAVKILDYIELQGIIKEAGSENLPATRINELLQHPYWFVRNTIILHQPLDFMQLTKLLFDENQMIRQNAANHPIMQQGIDNFP